ncbi:LOW QUALITY PROTEIN: hypothetical protein MAR_017116 [Mya arenaria]|uniref:Uncharacterized protein n=1 Tax=Mya arenaria TaxID=6604 RepID=A0ABY7EAU1_MYAAR|nr:LOW QUALITY PROTEIN: hypothetical protein MAR_017116 [Mya arenaria]
MDPSSEPFSNKHMKRRLIEYFGERIFISESCGKSNVVTLRSEASKLIENCYKQSTRDNDETKKTKIIQTAAKLIKNDISEIESNQDIYPGSEEIENVDKCLSYLPESLRILLDILITGKDTDLKKSCNWPSYNTVYKSNIFTGAISVLLSSCICCLSHDCLCLIKIIVKDPIYSIPTNFAPLPESIVADMSYNIDMLWKMSWLFRPKTPQWNGVMQMVHAGSHPAVSTTMLLPMIDMDPSNESCIYSTLSFVTDLASAYNVDPIITFDQPLWYKAQMIIDTQSQSSPMSHIVCRLGGLHIQMSFLGTIGKIMTDSGLKELLETVYAENVVPHMLSGKASNQ